MTDVAVVGNALVVVGGTTHLVLQVEANQLVASSGRASMLEVEALLRLAAPQLAALVVAAQESRYVVSTSSPSMSAAPGGRFLAMD